MCKKKTSYNLCRICVGVRVSIMIIALLVGHDDKIGSEMIFQQGTTFDIMHCRDSLDLERPVSKIYR